MTDWTRDTTWRQGSFLDCSAISELVLSSEESGDSVIVIVASHDCDLTQGLDIEPNVEVIVGAFVEKVEGNYACTKNVRKLHINIKSGDVMRAGEFLATKKIAIPKVKLAAFVPERSMILDVESLNIFQRWLAMRYRRSAFPDAFENRLKNHKLHEKISNILRKTDEAITGIFFDVDGGKELEKKDADDTYILDIIIVHGEKPDSMTARSSADDASKKIVEAFKTKLYKSATDTWTEIELRYCDVMSDEALSYRQSNVFKLWKLDHISLSEEPPQDVIEQM